MVSDLNTHGYRDAGGQETMIFTAYMQYDAEIASYASASRHARNDGLEDNAAKRNVSNVLVLNS